MGKFSIMCMQVYELDAAGYSPEEISEIVDWNVVDITSFLKYREFENYVHYSEEVHGTSGNVEDFSI